MNEKLLAALLLFHAAEGTDQEVEAIAQDLCKAIDSGGYDLYTGAFNGQVTISIKVATPKMRCTKALALNESEIKYSVLENRAIFRHVVDSIASELISVPEVFAMF